MAITIVNLTDPVSTFVNKVNTISGDVGDVSSLTTGDSNVVAAINTLRIDAFGDLIDSFNSLIFSLDSNLTNLDLTEQSKNALTGVNSGTGFGDLSYDSASGVFTFDRVTSSEIRGQISVNDSGGDGSLSYNSSTGVLTYIGPSAAEVRAHVSVTDAGGDGSLSYSSSTGVFTYTGPSASEVRAHLSAGEGIDFSSGVISGEDASTANKGIASFNSSRFSVSSGAVDIASGGIGETQLASNAVTQVKMADDAIGSAELKDVVTLIIYNSAGTPVKTLYGAGS